MEQPNFSYIDTLSGEDEAFKNKLIGIIKTEFPNEKDVYLQNIAANNFKKASENVHKLKHKITILGLEESYKIATDYENNLKENKDLGKEDFQNILKVITDFLATI
ncbi:Hpt domain-containing protein [Flavivirga aquimarina]|uniref:Hpt domain-containing protein n=1 Tax=Flavivirga aquimarina TaxID=2027862 RepID=A0ABT8W6F5_9FLAO|nr:Hpt domain-containing protein [Flavivirga aquimarina]MDO5968649.1 Hpt domain-containing protein [Flavivirga aquimarina]